MAEQTANGPEGQGSSGAPRDSPWTQTGAPGPSPWKPGGGIVNSRTRAGFGQRFGAYLIDAILITIVLAILIALAKGVGNALGAILSLAYFVYLEGRPQGQTLGKQALGIRVVDSDTGGSIGFGRALIRWLGRIPSAIPLLLGYFWMLWDPERQTWHDKLARDVVVRV